MKAVIIAAALLAAAPARAWEKVYDGEGIARFTEKAGKLWALPGLSSSTDRGASWSDGLEGDWGLDSDVSDDGRYASVLPKSYFDVTTLDLEKTTPDGAPSIAAWRTRFIGRSIMATGFIRGDKEKEMGVLVSSDGGLSWAELLEGKIGHSQELFALDERRAWIAAKDGTTTIWRTTNGGKDWERASKETPVFGECEDLFFLDRKRGWLATDGGPLRTIYATDDGGDEWEVRGTITVSTAGALSLAFADKKRGWAAAPGAFWETTDGGKTWTARPAPPSAVLPEAVALRYVEERRGGKLLYGTARDEELAEDDEENVTGRETRSRGEIWKLEAAAP